MESSEFIYNPPTGEIKIIYHDDNLLILSKPAGLLSVPGKGIGLGDCLESRIQAQFPDARIVHRLDMATSGVMVMAMNAKAHRHLGLQFERRHISKSYFARVWGEIDEDEGVIDLPLRCDWPNRPLQIVDHQQGKSAQTQWKVERRGGNFTDVVLFPKTGRSHQLRVHMLAIGHVILGDEFYGHEKARNAANRLMLHARSLALFHPHGGARHEFVDRENFDTLSW